MTNNTNRDFPVHCRLAKIEIDGKCTIHTLRKSCGQNWALAGVPIRTLQYLMGHSNSRTTLRFYQQVDAASAAQAVNATDAMLDAAAIQVDAQAGDKAQDFGRAIDAEPTVQVKSGARSE